MVGWQFSVTGNIDVAALGWFDWQGDGLNYSHEIGIWNTTGPSLLTSIIVPSGTAAALNNNFRYATLGAPITLTAGNTYVIAGYDVGSGGDPHVWDAVLGGYTNYEVIGFGADARIILTVGNALGGVAGGFGYPAGPIGDARSVLMGPNFLIAIPEPATTVLLMLLGVGGVAVCVRLRRTRPDATCSTSVAN